MNPTVLIAIPLLPLLAAIVAGLGGRLIGRAGAHWVTCGAVAEPAQAPARRHAALSWP